MSEVAPPEIALRSLHRCFEGAVPAVVATASAAGTPNVTYLSRVHLVDDERLALSNQFFSKTSRNLAENPRAEMVLVDPTTYEQFRVTMVYERTERRGPVFERLREDIDALAALEGMQDVFKLRAADIYRVQHVEALSSKLIRPRSEGSAHGAGAPPSRSSVPVSQPHTEALATLAARLARCADLDTLVSTTVDSLHELLGYDHSLLLLLDEDGRRLYTIASRGYDDEGVGSEVVVGEGLIGLVAARCAPMRVGSLRWMGKYSRSVRRSFEGAGEIDPARDIPVPGLPDAQSRVAVPAMSFGQLLGVLMIESPEVVAFSELDEAILTIVASIVAGSVERERFETCPPADGPPASVPPGETTRAQRRAGDTEQSDAGTTVRFYGADGSTFLDGDYLIKGVAGRILWSLLGQHERDERIDFTSWEVRLDPSLELPSFRDKFENRLILPKRRLDEREGPLRIEKTGRGRFRLHVDGPVRLELA
ncbi:MAG: GAF domain-containing protein [Acidimicrobiales bacterium]